VTLAHHLGYRRYHWHSALTAHEARAAFAEHVQEGSRYAMFDALADWHGRAFRGRVEAGAFVVARRIRYRNSFAPLIRLRLSDSPRGCVVDLTVQIEPTVAAFLAVWTSGVSVGFLVMLLSRSPLHALIPLGMLMFMLTLTGVGFSVEAAKTERQVRAILHVVDTHAEAHLA
jgi:hypothetical protein